MKHDMNRIKQIYALRKFEIRNESLYNTATQILLYQNKNSIIISPWCIKVYNAVNTTISHINDIHRSILYKEDTL